MSLTVSDVFERLSGRQGPFVIAEVGANHNGDMNLARRLVDSAVEVGASAVKFQSWTEKSLISTTEYQRNPGLREEIVKHELGRAQHEEIAAHCAANDIIFCSTPFSNEEADMLEELGVPFFKVASMDVNNLRLLRHIAAKNRPVLLSTGMATLGEIETAVDALAGEGSDEIVLLHCVSLYPPDVDQVNLRNIVMLRDVFGRPVGFSDHTMGVGVPLAAIALGASVIEKHFTLDKEMEGWDHSISADPEEMATIVSEGDGVWRALGEYRRHVSAAEIDKRKAFRRSAVTKRPMKAGEAISYEDLDFKRPGTGFGPNELDRLVGRRLAVDVGPDELLLPEQLQ